MTVIAPFEASRHVNQVKRVKTISIWRSERGLVVTEHALRHTEYVSEKKIYIYEGARNEGFLENRQKISLVPDQNISHASTRKRHIKLQFHFLKPTTGIR